VAPLHQSPGAHLLDTTDMTVLDAVEQVMEWFHEQARCCK